MFARARKLESRLIIGAIALAALVGCDDPLQIACTNSADDLPLKEDRTLTVGQVLTPRYRNYPCGHETLNKFAARHSSVEGSLEMVLQADSALHVRALMPGTGRIRVYDPDGIELLADIRVTIVQ